MCAKYIDVPSSSPTVENGVRVLRSILNVVLLSLPLSRNKIFMNVNFDFPSVSSVDFKGGESVRAFDLLHGKTKKGVAS